MVVNWYLVNILLLASCISLAVQFPHRHVVRQLLKRYKRSAYKYAYGPGHYEVCPQDRSLQANGMRVFLTVSSVASTTPEGVITERQIELNWFNDVVQDGDWVGLFDHDPTNNPIDPLKRVVASDYPESYYTTSVTFPRLAMVDISIERQCLGYWIGYIRAGATIAVDCLKIQPNWMWETRKEIATLKFRELMIPGSHDAGSYAYYKGRESDNIFTRWVITQEEDFWEQLMYGMRHFDLRVGYYSETPEKLWLNHNFVRVHPLAVAVDNFKKFLNSTQEILLLDIHRFPVGFTNRMERHLELMEYLTRELGDYMLNPSVGYDVTLETIWKSGKRVIVTYADSSYKNNALVWPGIPQIWANTMDITYLRDYMQQYMDTGRTDIWAAMVELTPTTADVLFTNSSLRILAEDVNKNVTEWARDLWWNEANVLAVDFFLGTNIVDVSIESNLKRKICLDQWHMSIVRAAEQARERISRLPPPYVGPRSSGL